MTCPSGRDARETHVWRSHRRGNSAAVVRWCVRAHRRLLFDLEFREHPGDATVDRATLRERHVRARHVRRQHGRRCERL
eukprot:622858-Prymnesium_polylepis.2